MLFARSIALAFLLVAAVPALAQEQPAKPAAEPRPGVLRLLPADAVSEKEVDVSGRKLAYTATAGTLSLYEQSGELSAAIFYTAYVAKNAVANRPITFVFNGGPGAASAFLHLGLVGPRIADFGPDGRDAAAARLRTNPETWLDFTDLVLIDPVGTGWSRPAKPDGGSAFWGVRRDAEAFAKTVALYLAKNGRLSSPKYLLGESYGGFRAAKLARALQREQGIIVSGIVMVSPMLEGAFQFGGKNFALGAALYLPSLAATELERRGTLNPQTLAEAERFAMTDYLTTLAGPPPQGEAARAFYDRVAGLTGLPAERWLNRAASSPTPRSSNCAPPSRRSSASTTRASRSRIRFRNRRRIAASIRCSTASRARSAAPSWLMRATSSATRPTLLICSSRPTSAASGSGTLAAGGSRASARICGCCWRSIPRSGCWSRTVSAIWSPPMG